MHKETMPNMRMRLDVLDPHIKAVIRAAQRVAGAKDVRAYLVGGFVRDLFLKVSNFDIDIVVEGGGMQFAEELAARLRAQCIRHKRFGTATIFARDRLKVDLASARKETYPEPASLPEVSPGKLQDDLARRDFSINAMAVSINADDFGTLVDIYGGRKDLNKKRISVLHEASFIDDPTRILRAIRFEQRFAFSISPYTLRCLRYAVKRGMLHKTHLHRVRDELILMLEEKNPMTQVRRLGQLCGFSFVHPRIIFSSKTSSLFRSIEAHLRWFDRNFARRRRLDRWLLYLIALLEPLSTSCVRHLVKKLALRRGDEKRLLDYRKCGSKVMKVLRKKTIPPSSVFECLEPLSYEVILFLAARANHAIVKEHVEDFFRHYNGSRHSICGKDLSALGIAPGPAYSKIFRALLNAKLDGKVRSKKDELDFVCRLKKSMR